MNKKLVLALLAVVLVVGGVLFFQAGSRGGAGRGNGEREAGAPKEAQPTAELEASTGLAAVQAPTAAAPERAAVASAVAGPTRGELAGLVGRVVEPDGRPVAGMRVALIEFEASLLFDGSVIDEPEGKLELEETITNAEGRFLLSGARAPAIHGLGIDLGGPRATFRVLDHALVHKERVDIGDVVLAPYGVLSGRVLDEGGAPIAGARVRAAPFPAEVLQGQPQDFRPDSLVSVSLTPMGGQGIKVIELPGWVRSAIERFPLPTTESKADGTFRLEGVALAQVIAGIDKPGLVGWNAGPLDLTGGAHDVGDVVLKHGRTVTGVVEDSSGDAVAGVEVFAGAELVPGIAAVLQPAGVTNEEGEFRLEGVREEGAVVATARRSRSEAWSTTVSPRVEGVRIELETLVQLTVNVKDQAGEPLAGVDLRLAPARDPDQQMGFFDVTAFLPRPPSPTGTFTEVEPGRYLNTKLGAGNYEISARSAGHAPGFLTANCLGEETEVTLTMPAGRRLDVTVLEAGSKTPIAAARTSVMRASGAGLTKLAVRVTGEDGHVVLGPLPDMPADGGQGFMPDTTIISVQHPRYGDHSVELDPTASELVVELQPGGTLAGKVHWGGAVPTRLYMFSLEFRGEEGFMGLFHLPRFTVTDLAGEFRIANLTPGKYRASLSERFLQQDPLTMMVNDFEPATLWREELEIRNGETTEIDIDLTPSGRGVTARLTGQVRFDGRALEGAKVRVSGNGNIETLTDARGRFETAEFSCLERVSVRIEGEVALGVGQRREMELYSEWLKLENEEVKDLQLDLYPIPLRTRVLADASNEPIAGARVSAQLQKENRGWSGNEPVVTDANGEAELLVLQPGEYTVSAEGDGFTRMQTTATVTAEGVAEPVALRLRQSVPCAGRVQIDPLYANGPNGFSYLWVTSEQGNSSGAGLEQPEHTFELENLPPGTYTAHLYVGGRQGEEVTFELGPNGDENLLFTFTPRATDDE